MVDRLFSRMQMANRIGIGARLYLATIRFSMDTGRYVLNLGGTRYVFWCDFFIEPISRRDHPLLYWMIITTWLVGAAYMISTLFIKI